MEKIIKVILALLFFLCLLEMPYGYYQLIRYLAMVGFAVLAYKASDRENKTEFFIYACLALLFQPLFKISLGRTIWNVVDLVVGIGLLLSIFIKPNKFNSK